LESLEFLIIGHTNKENGVYFNTNLAAWSDMDVALSPPGAFPCLRTVKIELILGWVCFLDEVEEEYQQMLYVRDQAFPLLSANEAVEIIFTIVCEAI
jgi:hypothetical protein